MQVQCDTDPAVFDRLRDEWEALLSRSVMPTPFLRPFWQKAWWTAYQQGKTLRLITVREGERLVGIAPLFLHEMRVAVGELLPRLSIERPEPLPEGAARRILHPLGGTEVSDYLDLIVDREQAGAVYAALWDFLKGQGDWELLDLHCLPSGSPTLEALPRLAQASGWRAETVQEEVCPIIALPASWEAYLDSLDKKQRHEIRRKIRKAEREASVRWRVSGGADELEADLELFFRLHERSDPAKEAFWNAETRQFFRTIAGALQQDQALQLSFIYFDEQPVATYFSLLHDGEMLLYNSGYEPGLFMSLSPGLVLLSYMIEDAIQRGYRIFDFMRGNERYKYDYGGVDRPIYRLGIAPAS